MKTNSSWLHPEPIAALLAAAGEAAMVLTYAEDRAFAGVSLNRFASVNSTRLDWRGAEVLERSEEFDGDGLRKMVRRYGADSTRCASSVRPVGEPHVRRRSQNRRP
ncbi:hypothetical protein SCYAM73S_06544 [Streptomyces cyaneofuscatus]